ncbi:dimethyladenosine transferase [Kosmotoga arenicorallina S304]|uniref:Ribosomal RNA small subunit methyltransferase A n=1 Tax=Kosmotoga arenicorallina S304 TaxID=1453497 RepID=A0A182C7Y9_9BACT|nr:16S rRNA (adenine(1518)-N(6)/adenine(1519)-N(6))-dimethyltransferase RsmA [Kosmotoga arenicorallina]OAA31839.1 dimethyladenosine transferase [Kosmotoga arenicorallina S304]
MDLKKNLKDHKISLKRSLGQNFLLNKNISSKILNYCALTNNDTVIEIGVGAGILTELLLRRARKVIAYEIDKSLDPLISPLKKYENLQLLFQDFLKADLSHLQVDGDLYFVANVPYYITSPIIEKIMFDSPPFKEALLMVQKEYADRLLAKPGTKTYGALTVSISAFSKVTKLFDVSKKNFVPVPGVDSSVIKLEPLTSPKISYEEKSQFRAFVRSSFAQRRKKLKNNLKRLIRDVEEFLKDAGLSENIRAEELSTDTFIDLYHMMKRW